ncbi:MAG: RNA methyltransferase [Bryobacterales bacterium]|nr:RNA methyltransferase [Bryobacteraceae bacterium]MDW8354941.1 RNA methyltransferase [Bryobacterales bacterium]
MTRFEHVTSTANPLVRQIRRALGRGGLTEDGCCIAETVHLLEEALRSECEVRAVLVAESARPALEKLLERLVSVRVALTPDSVFRSLSTLESSQGLLALVRAPAWSLPQLLSGQILLVVLDGIQDPGNAGTILRTAEAFGASGLVFLKGTVSPFNPKAVRASAGSLFRLPFVWGADAQRMMAAFREHGLAVYAATPSGCTTAAQADFRRPCALIIGSEARGVSDLLRADATQVRIPTRRVESLNAAVATAILLYEAWQQRTRSP